MTAELKRFNPPTLIDGPAQHPHLERWDCNQTVPTRQSPWSDSEDIQPDSGYRFGEWSMLSGKGLSLLSASQKMVTNHQR